MSLAAALVAVVLAHATGAPRVGPTTPAGPMLDRLNQSMRQPVPALPPPTGQHPADVWVPDRIVPIPGSPHGAHVPGHWERRISDREHYVPPLVIRTPDGGTVALPAGTAPPPDQRQSPWVPRRAALSRGMALATSFGMAKRARKSKRPGAAKRSREIKHGEQAASRERAAGGKRREGRITTQQRSKRAA